MINVVFICLGNICRSPMAEFIFRKMVTDLGAEKDFTILSRATSDEEEGNPVYPPARSELLRHGIDPRGKIATVLDHDEIVNADYLICMDDGNLSAVKRMGGEACCSKTCKLLDFTGGGNIKDPWYSGRFDATYDDIVRGLEGFLRKLGYK